jgi:hypothetical protein
VSVHVEFVGGPLDGERRVMPDDRPRWFFPPAPSLGLISATGSELLTLPRPLVYEHIGSIVEISADAADRHLLYELKP